MTQEFKICSKCFEKKPREEFYKHRASCKSCKINYQKNRYHDLKDGKRDMVSWYNKNQEMTNERMIKHLNKVMQERKKTTHTVFVPEVELRCTDDNSSRLVFLWTMLPIVIVIYVVLNDLGFV